MSYAQPVKDGKSQPYNTTTIKKFTFLIKLGGIVDIEFKMCIKRNELNIRIERIHDLILQFKSFNFSTIMQ